MGYTKTNYHDVEPTSDAMYFLRDELEAEKFGLTVVECDPGWEGMAHDHDDEDHEEAYLLLEGEATVVVEDEAVSMEPGDAIRIDPGTERRIENGETESTFVLVGAP